MKNREQIEDILTRCKIILETANEEVLNTKVKDPSVNSAWVSIAGEIDAILIAATEAVEVYEND